MSQKYTTVAVQDFVVARWLESGASAKADGWDRNELNKKQAVYFRLDQQYKQKQTETRTMLTVN